MDHVTKTIDECKELIVSKSLDVNISYASNRTLLDAFLRLISVPYIWCGLCAIFYTKIWCDFKTFIITLIAYIVIFLIGKLLKSWITYNFKDSYNNIKINVVRNLVENCKELRDMDCPLWQKKQLMKEMADLGGVAVSWDNDK